jgi:hypothetical protein
MLRALPFLLFALLLHGPAVRADETGAEADDAPRLRRHQLMLGIGTGAAFEKDIFNVGESADPAAARPEPAYDFAYAYNLNANWAVGVHLRGYTHGFHDYVSAEGGPARVKFTLDTYNQALRIQRFFSRDRLQPYAYVEAGLANGQAQGEGDKLEYSGASVGAGGGVVLTLTRFLAIYADGVLSLGAAKWESKPFANSTSRDFNPSYGAVTAGATLMIP